MDVQRGMPVANIAKRCPRIKRTSKRPCGILESAQERHQVASSVKKTGSTEQSLSRPELLKSYHDAMDRKHIMILICSTDILALIQVLSRLTIPNRQENKEKESLGLINVRSKVAWTKVEIFQLQISLFFTRNLVNSELLVENKIERAITSGIDFAEHNFL